MRFITEFEITEADRKHDNWLEYLLAKQKHYRQADMGTMVADLFGWQNPVLENDLRYRLEIEAFPMDKWLDFKHRLWNEINLSNIHREPVDNLKILELIKELESFGKSKQDD